MKQYDVIIIGAGAAGLMCAAQASKRGRSVLLLDKCIKAAKKILISGGGRCNFTNLYIEPEAYISNNSHFCKSALSRYTQWDFIVQLESHQLSWTEKTLGQLFCDQKSNAVVNMLLEECADVDIILNANVDKIDFNEQYLLNTSQGDFQAQSLVIASGGPSIPKMGATDFGLQIAKQFRHKSIGFKPGLVPFTFSQQDISRYFKDLSGLSLEVSISCNGQSFKEMALITHRGISGPAVLQISSYWQKSQSIEIDLLPGIDATKLLLSEQQQRGTTNLKNILNEYFSKRLALRLTQVLISIDLSEKSLGEINQADLKTFAEALNNWVLTPSGTEGMRTAEVCTGGVDTNELSSKTMESSKQPGLYFIGETVDVTGWLGGYNFQWAWSSGWAAGQVV
ncbi:NAD(FAD)-utilizing dehydrogenases [Bathymodiolus heckerae thiotrophic gill symbiont]|uniref:NAD(P)/FAD-dependent oxidoreductase n=1 Tax=Bathymodiolus heckerae thiotrophic gill symbiont TaxID=1052212 RepID=UPI0010BC6D85|nr:NAD(P)/FAD-dependent oxidoreductase [Bathymodiolus heckerae thiotrophic gill symbiont]SHN91119.1 NAD(FAD)-utilizing dehydrogenases [Bathymodiolus heckerae thiotrophic gill symbiont]